MKKDRVTGRFLAKVLRHNPNLIDLRLDENGWANVDELIEKSAILVKRLILIYCKR